MASINSLEMGKTLSTNPNINITKGFLGIGGKAIYTPTNSPLSAVINHYNVESGEPLLKLIDSSDEEIIKKVSQLPALKKLNLGNYRFEACISADHQFVAIQAMRYADFTHSPIREVKYFEGEAAKAIASVL